MNVVLQNLSLNFWILAVALLYAEDIGPEEVILGKGSYSVQREMRSKPLSKAPKKDLSLSRLSKLQKKAFLLAFKRQSHVLKKKCLIPFNPGPTSTVLRATMYKTGRLKNISSVDKNFPECVQIEIQKMRFEHIARNLMQNETYIQWRVSW